jgi:hypothetical protein
MRWWIVLGIGLASTALGCGVSPQPEPPSARPKLDADSVLFDPKTIIVDAVAFIGEPGAVVPAEGDVVVINLDSTGPPVVRPVESDGSFQLVIAGKPDDEYRFQIRSPKGRSQPIDLVGDVSGALLGPVPHPLADCLTLTPALELEFASVKVASTLERTIVIRNDCASPLSFAASSFRTSIPAFVQVVAAPGSLAPGAQASVTLRFAPQSLGPVEEVFFVEVPLPDRDRRPISLFGTGN